MQAYLPTYLKSKNRKLVFDLFLEHRELSRAGITRMTEMSFPTVQKVVDFMLSKNIVIEPGDTISSGDGLGRRSRVLRFNPDAYHSIGLAIEGKFANVGLVDLQGNVLEQHMLKTGYADNHFNLMVLSECIQDILRRNTEIPILGIGIGFPGVVNPGRRSILRCQLLKIDSEIPFDELFPEFVGSLSLPLFLDNDVNLACRGENFLRMRSHSSANLAYLSLGTGYGAGLIIDGNLRRGSNYKSGEIGHMIVDKVEVPFNPHKPVCTLENMIDIDAINQRFHINIESERIIDESLRLEICDYLCSYLCFAIYNLLAVLDIDDFVLSGVIPETLGDVFYQKLNAQVNLLVNDNNRPIRISHPASSSTGVVGGAISVVEHLIFDVLKDDE